MSVSSPADSDIPDDESVTFDNRDLSGRVYQVLQREILQGKLPPGTRLSLDELAERFRISVSPIRDALRLLAADGLVELRSRRGAFVTQPSRVVIQEAFQFRAILECAAVDAVIAAGPAVLETLRGHVAAMTETMVGETHADYLAYIAHDQSFHRTLVETIGNGKLLESYVSLASFTLIARLLHRSENHRATATLAEHRVILDALAAGEAETARAAIRAHLEEACTDLLRRSDALTSAATRGEEEA